MKKITKENRIKVLFFLPSTTGGAERVTISIAKMLPKETYDVTFVIVHPTLGTIVNFIPSEYKVLHLPIKNIYDFTTIRMIRLIKREKPDFVFCSLMYLNSRLLIASKICGVRAIVRNNIDFSKISQGLTTKLVCKTYKWAYKIVAQQEEMHDEIIEYTHVSPSKVITLHNPIDIENVEKKSDAPSPFKDNGAQVKYVWAGRFSPEKGQDLAVKALQKVRTHIPNAHLYLVGMYDWNNDYDNRIKAFVEENNLSEFVHFVGFDTNPYRWIKNCDCYVMPSRLEGLPNSLIEAMYLGKPVVATNCIPVVSRIVQDGYNGIIAESENIDSIADGMMKALELKDFKMTYKPASKENFIELFEK